MNTYEINNYLKNEKCYIGTFPRDKLPKYKVNNCALIINTDPSYKPGEHWVAIFIKNNYGIYYDCFGNPPLNQEILKFLNFNCSNGWSYNKLIIQTPSIYSNTCGHYCIWFVLCMCNNLSFNDFISIFNNTFINDIIIKILINK
jgi:hypothetical protein